MRVVRLILEGSSPHTRGAPRPGFNRSAPAGIIPAYAGSTNQSTIRASRNADHPRIRGEHLILSAPGGGTGGSSPHTRGAPHQPGWWGPHPRIIPAYAGSTAYSADDPRRRPDHPRIRGEHAAASSGKRRWVGSSPHTRGALERQQRHALDARIIPAYAGSTFAVLAMPAVGRDHPRIRGEHA